MYEVPTPKEFARIFRRMDIVHRHRLSKIAGTGRVADDPAEAALVAAVARLRLRQLPWLIALFIGLFGLELAKVVTTDDQVTRWLAFGVMFVAVAGIAKILLRDRPRLVRAERLNRAVAAGQSAGTY